MSEHSDARPGEADTARERDEIDDGSRREVLARIGRLAYALLAEPRLAHANCGGVLNGGIGGVRLAIEECETGYDSQKGVECYERTKVKGPLVYNPAFDRHYA